MSREPEFLITAVHRFLQPAVAFPDARAIDWTTFIRLADAHSVIPMVYKAFSDVPIPETASRELRVRFDSSVKWSLAQSAELTRVIDLLQCHNIAVVALKGPLLSRYLYGDLGSRTSGDIDFLAKRDRILEIRRILISNQYRVKSTAHWDCSSACLRSRESEMSFESPSGIRMDMHWRLIPPFFASPCDAFDPWTQLNKVELAGRTLDTLAPESLFLFLCSHGSKHTFERLGWICDVARFLYVTPGLNWPQVLAQARKASALRQVLLSVRLAAELFGAPCPANFPLDSKVDRLAAFVCARLLRGETPPASAADSTHFGLRLMESPRQRVRFLAGLYITPSEADYKAVNLPPWLHFLYYPYRPVRLLWRNAIGRRQSPRRGLPG